MSWGIDRVGMKVICVQPPDVWQNFCCDLTSWPVLDAVYTVSGFALIEDAPGVYLQELPPVSCQCHQLSGAPWPLQCFRAIDERKTDITAFTKLLDAVPEMV